MTTSNHQRNGPNPRPQELITDLHVPVDVFSVVTLGQREQVGELLGSHRRAARVLPQHTFIDNSDHVQTRLYAIQNCLPSHPEINLSIDVRGSGSPTRVLALVEVPPHRSVRRPPGAARSSG